MRVPEPRRHLLPHLPRVAGETRHRPAPLRVHHVLQRLRRIVGPWREAVAREGEPPTLLGRGALGLRTRRLRPHAPQRRDVLLRERGWHVRLGREPPVAALGRGHEGLRRGRCSGGRGGRLVGAGAPAPCTPRRETRAGPERTRPTRAGPIIPPPYSTPRPSNKTRSVPSQAPFSIVSPRYEPTAASTSSLRRDLTAVARSETSENRPWLGTAREPAAPAQAQPDHRSSAAPDAHQPSRPDGSDRLLVRTRARRARTEGREGPREDQSHERQRRMAHVRNQAQNSEVSPLGSRGRPRREEMTRKLLRNEPGSVLRARTRR